MLIGNISFTDANGAQTIFDNTVDQQLPISQLWKTQNGRFLLGYRLLSQIHSYTGFNEVRVWCYKPWHGRVFHAILSGSLVNHVLGKTGSTYDHCKDARFLSDDTSQLGQTKCSDLKTGFGPPHIYHHLLFKYPNHVQIVAADRFECDDYINAEGYQNTGQWLFYLR